MPSTGSLLALAAAASTANAAFQGFNYGAAFSDGRLKVQEDFEAEFTTAANLDGTNGAFTSARLYTMVQGNTPNYPISAIPAAINTGTSLLFGLWASAGDDAFNNEIEALQNTIDQYCDQLDGLVAGISVGSEDLYRNSPTGIANGEYAGAHVDTLVRYIERVRDVVEGTCLGDAPIGHVDTWTAFVNATNQPVIEAIDWIGFDAYAYFENTKPNGIENAAGLFQEALSATEGVAQGKPIWITETGWPVSGEDFGDAIPSPENARTFWEEVGCPRFGEVNVWWYTFQDSAPQTPNPSFGVIGSELTTTPLYDLSCDGSDDDDPPASSSAASSTKTSEATSEATSEHTGEPTSQPTSQHSSDHSDVPEPTHEPTTTEDDDEHIPEPTHTEGDDDNDDWVPTPSSSHEPETTEHHEPTVTHDDDSTTWVTVSSTWNTTVPGETWSTGSDGAGVQPTETPPPSAGNKVNSLSAAALAVIVAAGFL